MEIENYGLSWVNSKNFKSTFWIEVDIVILQNEKYGCRCSQLTVWEKEGFVAYCTSAASSTKTMIFLHKLQNVGW